MDTPKAPDSAQYDRPSLPHAAVVVPPEVPVVSTLLPPLPARRRDLPPVQDLPADMPIEITPFETFTFGAGRPLSPEDMQTITLFHETYHQRPLESWTQRVLRDAQRDAEVVLPLMQRQLDLASQTPEGARGQEAKQIQANMDWIARNIVGK